MNYSKIYVQIIVKRLKNLPCGYVEKHHILPKSFGGSNDEENIVALTPREHFLVHRLLAKMFPKSGMVHAVYKMACSDRIKYRVTSRIYEILRIEHAHRVSNDEVAKKRKSEALKGKKQSEKHIKTRIDSRKNSGNGWHSEETKKKISETNTGKIGVWKGKKMPSDLIKRRNKTRQDNDNYKWSEETKKKSSESLKEYYRINPKIVELTEERKAELRKEKTKIVKCPHCDKTGTVLIMPRWHFNNCKFKISQEIDQEMNLVEEIYYDQQIDNNQL